MTPALGQPTYFDINKYLDCVEGQINADEVERALWMLDNPPAFYRLNPPPRLTQMRERLHRQLFTPVQYAKCLEEEPLGFTADMQMPSRGELVDKFVKELNEKNICPVVCELAPGGRWIDGIMTKRGRKFWYEHMGLDKQHIKMAKPEGQPYNIFIAFELIEHLPDPFEIYRNYLKFERPADTIFLSTPFCTFAGGMDKWQERELGHLRAYTPEEFHSVAKKMFEGYTWDMVHDSVMVLIGNKK